MRDNFTVTVKVTRQGTRVSYAVSTTPHNAELVMVLNPVAPSFLDLDGDGEGHYSFTVDSQHQVSLDVSEQIVLKTDEDALDAKAHIEETAHQTYEVLITLNAAIADYIHNSYGEVDRVAQMVLTALQTQQELPNLDNIEFRFAELCPCGRGHFVRDEETIGNAPNFVTQMLRKLGLDTLFSAFNGKKEEPKGLIVKLDERLYGIFPDYAMEQLVPVFKAAVEKRLAQHMEAQAQRLIRNHAQLVRNAEHLNGLDVEKALEAAQENFRLRQMQEVQDLKARQLLEEQRLERQQRQDKQEVQWQLDEQREDHFRIGERTTLDLEGSAIAARQHMELAGAMMQAGFNLDTVTGIVEIADFEVKPVAPRPAPAKKAEPTEPKAARKADDGDGSDDEGIPGDDDGVTGDGIQDRAQA